MKWTMPQPSLLLSGSTRRNSVSVTTMKCWELLCVANMACSNCLSQQFKTKGNLLFGRSNLTRDQVAVICVECAHMLSE